jgi:hypothetical protein
MSSCRRRRRRYSAAYRSPAELADRSASRSECSFSAHAGFNALGAPPYANEIAMGAVLLVVAIADGPYLLRRVRMARLRITKARQSG